MFFSNYHLFSDVPIDSRSWGIDKHDRACKAFSEQSHISAHKIKRKSRVSHFSIFHIFRFFEAPIMGHHRRPTIGACAEMNSASILAARSDAVEAWGAAAGFWDNCGGGNRLHLPPTLSNSLYQGLNKALLRP